MNDSRNMPDRQAQGRARTAASMTSALAPILPYLREGAVVEIMLNADGAVWVERAQMGMECTGIHISPREAERMLRSIAGELELELNASSPSLACKLPIWGARVQASIPPIVAAPILTLRKPAAHVWPLDHYVQQQVITERQACALQEAVAGRLNILIGGGTASGKTTFANGLLREVSASADRVLIVEDTAELQCASPNRVELLVQPPVYTWRDAVMDAMRHRPDRIIVGEVRDGAALDLLKAWNTGHPGGLATIHANDTRGMLDRFCQLVEEVIAHCPRTIVAQCIHVCVHMARDASSPAGRVVTGIDRVLGYDADSGWVLAPLVAAPEGDET
jgi:P-type conjugative transfer ATPase TrbB